MSTERLAEVRIVGLPLDVYKIAAEHFDELKREFALLRAEAETADSIPNKLVTVSDQLTTRYSGFTTTPNDVRDKALRRGDATVDLVYSVPLSVKEACVELEKLLDEADEFCRRGQHLLTLAAPPEVADFRRWFLDEFVNQIGGEAPMSWEEYRAATNRRIREAGV